MSTTYCPDGETSSPSTGDMPLAEEDLSDEAMQGADADDIASMSRPLPLPAPSLLTPGYDPLSAPILPGDRWNGTAGGPTPPKDDRIEDESGLMRAFTSLRRATRALEQNKRMQAPALEEARRELADLEAQCAKANADLEARAEHHRNRIEVYARTHRDELVQGKRKTRDFGIGSVSFRKAGGEYRWRKDMTPKEREAALLAWAREAASRVATDLPLMVETVERPVLAGVKAALAALDDPEEPRFTPPGLEYVEEHEKLEVTVKGE